MVTSEQSADNNPSQHFWSTAKWDILNAGLCVWGCQFSFTSDTSHALTQSQLLWKDKNKQQVPSTGQHCGCSFVCSPLSLSCRLKNLSAALPLEVRQANTYRFGIYHLIIISCQHTTKTVEHKWVKHEPLGNRVWKIFLASNVIFLILQ